MATTLDSPAGTMIVFVLRGFRCPQATTVPSDLRARQWCPPPAMALTLSNPCGSGAVLVSPHTATNPAELTAGAHRLTMRMAERRPLKMERDELFICRLIWFRW